MIDKTRCHFTFILENGGQRIAVVSKEESQEILNRLEQPSDGKEVWIRTPTMCINKNRLMAAYIENYPVVIAGQQDK